MDDDEFAAAATAAATLILLFGLRAISLLVKFLASCIISGLRNIGPF